MITFSPIRIVLLVIVGLIGAIIGALTGAFYGIPGWQGAGPTIILAIIGAVLLVVEVNEVSNAQRLRLAIGLILGAAFGVIWAQLGDGAIGPTLGHAANWAVYGFFVSSATRETLVKARRWTIGGAIGGVILGIVLAVMNTTVNLGATISLQPHDSWGEALGAIVITTMFVTFWSSVIGLQSSTPVRRRMVPQTDRPLRPIRKVVR